MNKVHFLPILLNLVGFLVQHETVLECAVLGLPDEAYGEVICAIIVPKEDAKKRAEQDLKPAITLEALTNWSKDKLAPYKVCYSTRFPFFLAALMYCIFRWFPLPLLFSKCSVA